MQPPTAVTTHLAALGLDGAARVHYGLAPPLLYEHALDRDEAHLADGGALLVRTDPYTGRSPNDRFIVASGTDHEQINWGPVNQPTDPATFDGLFAKMQRYADGRDLFVRDVFAGWDPAYQLPVRVITEKAWHNLFAYNMFVRKEVEALSDFEPRFTVIDFCELDADPATDGTHSEAFVLINMDRRLVLIGGTHYGGEIKKAIFSVLNYMLTDEGVLPMHCSANVGPGGDAAVFFGLSGTGKTTLSADRRRTLIGDDEHGWSSAGVFNFEGGCYAKMIDITPESEPEIHGTTDRFGTILENVIVDPETRTPDFSDDAITRNTRGSYPLHYIPNASTTGQGPHPSNVIFLTYDAFGVLPPIAKLTPEQAMYHFLSGYTAKVAGTECGVSEPKATFSACFGEPFMVRHPSVYAELLGARIRRHDVDCWLVNTGITGGPYGTGHRMPLSHTRTMVHAALDGTLAKVDMHTEPVFGLAIPRHIEGVPDAILQPRATWDDPEAYDRQARALARMFADNFEPYAASVSDAVHAAGPRLEASAESS